MLRTLLILLLVVTPVLVWLFSYERVPAMIRIAPGSPTGLGWDMMKSLSDHLEKRGYPATVLKSNGSHENRELLLKGQADLAVVKAGAVDLTDLEVVAPINPDTVVLLTRKSLHIRDVEDLENRRIILGRAGSGSRELALTLFHHYQISEGEYREVPGHFADLVQNPEVADAAVVCTAITNPELIQLVRTGQFDILPIEDSPALVLLHPFYLEATIPRGMFAEKPPAPPVPTPTLSTWALMVARKDCSSKMLTVALESLYCNSMQMSYPVMLPRKQAASWSFPPLHPASRTYFDPYGGLNTASDFLQSLSALKELGVALAALLWLGWQRYQVNQERLRQAELSHQKERLDQLIEESIRMERELMDHLRDQQTLDRLFREITDLKLRALSEMTHEELRTDRGFTVLMTQCRDLVEKIQRCEQFLVLEERQAPSSPT